MTYVRLIKRYLPNVAIRQVALCILIIYLCTILSTLVYDTESYTAHILTLKPKLHGEDNKDISFELVTDVKPQKLIYIR